MDLRTAGLEQWNEPSFVKMFIVLLIMSDENILLAFHEINDMLPPQLAGDKYAISDDKTSLTIKGVRWG